MPPLLEEAVQSGLAFLPAGLCLQGEVLPAGGQQGGAVKAFQPPHQPVGGEYRKARVGHVGEGHEDVLAAGQIGALPGQGVPIAQAGFIAVVAVGDVQLPPGEVLPQGLYGHGVVDDPQPVGHQAVGERVPGRAGAGQVFQPLGGGVALVLVEGVDGAEIAPGGGKQLEAVLLGLGECLLVGEHHAVGEVLQPHQAHQAPHFFGFAVVHLGEELLLIEVEPRVHIQLEDALLPPGAQGAGGLLIGVLPLFGQLQADDVAAVAGEVLPPLLLADDVIGRAGQFLDGACLLQVVAQCPKGPDFCHSCSLPFSSVEIENGVLFLL